MTLREILLLLAVTALFVGAIALGSGQPLAEVWWAGLPIVGGVGLGLTLRRALDRGTAKRLAGELARRPGAVEASSYSSQGMAVGTLTALCAREVGWFQLRPTVGRPGWRLLRWLGLSHRLSIDDDDFNAAVYVDRNPALGTALFSARETREAALALFRLGFVVVEYRNGLVQTRRKGKVPPEIATSAEPHMRALAAASR